MAEEKEHRRRRTLPIDEGTLEVLREYIDRGGSIETDGKQLLFGLSCGQAWKVVGECADRAGLGQLDRESVGMAIVPVLPLGH